MGAEENLAVHEQWAEAEDDTTSVTIKTSFTTTSCSTLRGESR
jgi:hypothetical protein